MTKNGVPVVNLKVGDPCYIAKTFKGTWENAIAQNTRTINYIAHKEVQSVPAGLAERVTRPDFRKVDKDAPVFGSN